MWKSSKIEKLNVEKTCRSCLAQSDQLTSLFAVADNNELSFGDILANIANTKFDLYNVMDFPTKICDLCHEDLLIAYNFKIKTEKSENILHEYLKNQVNKQITVPLETNYGFTNIKTEINFDDDGVSQINEERNEEVKVDNEYVKTDDDNFIARSGEFYCLVCDESFKGKLYLEKHMKFHLKEKSTNLLKLPVLSSQYDPIATNEQCDKSSCKIITKNDLQLDINISKPDTKLNFNVQKNYGCQYCSSRFSHQTQLDCHMKAHTAKKFFCEACDRYFVNNRNLQRHLKLHYDPNAFKCFECNKTFESKLRWKLHERSHLFKESTVSSHNIDEHSCLPNETKTLECKICGTHFTKIFFLREHLRSHKKSETINIENIRKNNHLINLLPEGVKNMPKLIDYILIELEAGRYENFYSATNMVGDELRLSDSETDTDSEDSKKLLQVNLYVCQLCEQTFTRRYKILYHQRNDHIAEELENECGICEIKYVSKNLLDYHIKTQCGNTDKRFTCDVCKKKYMWKENIQRHIRIHHKNEQQQSVKLFRQYIPTKKLECDICKKTFTRLDRHRRTHKLEKQYQCKICLRKFTRNDTLKAHMKVHDEYVTYPTEESKLYLCTFCGKKFRSSSNLSVHTRRHTGEKPYKCDFCDKGFPSSSDLNTHRRTHRKKAC